MPALDGPAGELRVAVAADITGVYPDVRDESFTFAVLSNAYEGLTRLGHDLRPEPAVAPASTGSTIPVTQRDSSLTR